MGARSGVLSELGVLLGFHREGLVLKKILRSKPHRDKVVRKGSGQLEKCFGPRSSIMPKLLIKEYEC